MAPPTGKGPGGLMDSISGFSKGKLKDSTTPKNTSVKVKEEEAGPPAGGRGAPPPISMMSGHTPWGKGKKGDPPPNPAATAATAATPAFNTGRQSATRQSAAVLDDEWAEKSPPKPPKGPSKSLGQRAPPTPAGTPTAPSVRAPPPPSGIGGGAPGELQSLRKEVAALKQQLQVEHLATNKVKEQLKFEQVGGGGGWQSGVNMVYCRP